MAGGSADRRTERGLKAAYGEHHRLTAALRTQAGRRLRQYDHVVRRTRSGDYLEFVPATTDPKVLADLSARVNWFLADRQLPIYMEGVAGIPISPDDAPHMEPSLVRDPGWEETRPRGKPELVVYDVTPATLFRHLASPRRSAIVSPWLAWEAEKGWWFELQRRLGSTRAPDAHTSAERFFNHVSSRKTAFVLGTGPSATSVDFDRITADVRITCNSAVRNTELLAKLVPQLIGFTDPIFHCGPSRYAAQFRADLERALDQTGAIPISGEHWVNPVLTHHPRIAERIAVVRLDDSPSAPFRWPTRDDFSVRTTSNVLTLLMLPAALALADSVEVAGCDGRKPGENYFWKHNPAVQYDDELMQTVFTAHPGFFRERDYALSFTDHGDELQRLIATGEAAGKNVVSVTPSYIPALAARSRPTQAA